VRSTGGVGGVEQTSGPLGLGALYWLMAVIVSTEHAKWVMRAYRHRLRIGREVWLWIVRGSGLRRRLEAFVNTLVM